MPDDDLLRFIGEPPAFSTWWLVLGVCGLVLVLLWCAGVHVWTMPAGRLQNMRGAKTFHAWLIRRRFAAAVRRTGELFRSGAITPVQACAELSRAVRGFLALSTGRRVQYLHVSEIVADTAVAGAAPLLAALTAAQFDPDAEVDIDELARASEELITAWN